VSNAPDLGRLLARKGEASPAAERTFTLSDPARFASLRLPVRPVAQVVAARVPAAPPRPARIGVTLRLDPVRHERLRHVGRTAGRSMQSLLLDAFDSHLADLPEAGDGLPILLAPPRRRLG